LEIIEKALQVASRAHEGQYRKTTDIPYISHPAAVGMMLMRDGYDDETVAAGILHDTVEDTQVTLDEIKALFGERVAGIVEGCSEPEKALSWEERKEHTIEFLKTAPEEVRVVSCADKLHNIRSISDSYSKIGDAAWDRFNRGKEQQEWYYRSLVTSLGSQSEFSLLEQLRREVNKIFGVQE
jgi:(p)ppGpp synthase/HD superfamily hydrolase